MSLSVVGQTTSADCLLSVDSDSGWSLIQHRRISQITWLGASVLMAKGDAWEPDTLCCIYDGVCEMADCLIMIDYLIVNNDIL